MKNCIVCNSHKKKFMFYSKDRMLNLAGSFNVKKCIDCSLLFIDPQPSVKILKKHYPSKNYYAYNKNTDKGFFEILREYLIAHYYTPNVFTLFMSTFIQKTPAMPSFVENGKILDVGCGAGDMLILLKKLGWETYGLDMDKRAIENAKKRGLDNIQFGTYIELSKYPNNYFDVIRLYHVIEHIDNPSQALNLINKKLKKGGELVIGTPNGSSLLSSFFGSYWYNLDSPRHLFLFSPKTLSKIIVNNNFTIDTVEFCSVGGIVGSIQYMLEDFFGKRINLIHKFYIILLFYPLEWILDRLSLGDVFTIKARKI